jgi:DNA-binding beta-propeller fold protein YncE
VNKQGDTVSFMDPAERHRILAEVKMPAHPHEVMIDPMRRVAYVSIYGNGIYGNNTYHGHEVYILSLDMMIVNRVIEMSPLEATHAFAWGPKGTLLVACDKSNAVAVIDLDDRKVIGTIPTGTHGCHWVLSIQGGQKAYNSNNLLAALEQGRLPAIGPEPRASLDAQRDGAMERTTGIT